ncbi:MAG TPA: alpha/beta family hydrolase, partial [Candidatus Dormibacteraeota bacterium]|nr:alpha/beta family hydrolase [Candidatus Dormibacteraeota bacterium]
MPASTELAIAVGDGVGAVSALFLEPPGAAGPRAPRAVYVLAHGAGAGMRHPFLETVARALAERDVATLRYQFPYMER